MTLENDPLLQCLTDYMFVPDAIVRADATIVLGMTLWQRPLAMALALHEQDLAGTLVFSGGSNPKLALAESLHMVERWVALKKSSEKVLVDSLSSNTRENMIHSKRLLETSGLYDEDMRINIIAINYHMRRAVETFRAVFGTRISLGVVNYQSIYCHPENWYRNPQGKRLICTEVRKIMRYLPNANYPKDVQGLLSMLDSHDLSQEVV